MATRRPASAARDGIQVPCPLRIRAGAWPSVTGLGRIIPVMSGLGMIGLAIAPLPASAQYMAHTPRQTAATPMAAPEVPRPVPPPARPAEHAFNGQLPHQRTGAGRQRVVRDICIGCDR